MGNTASKMYTKWNGVNLVAFFAVVQYAQSVE